MTDNTQPEALALANEVRQSMLPDVLKLWAAEAAGMIRRQHARIAELQARIKTMAEEHADELMVAHLDGRMRAAQPAGAQRPGAAYAALPDADRDYMRKVVAVAVTMLFDGHKGDVTRVFSTGELSEFVTITAAMGWERVEDIYRRAWDLLSLPDRASHVQAPAQAAHQQEAQEPVAWRELCRRLYVELYYCNQQMTSGKRPKWQQGKTVRDVLADAKAALDAAPQPTPTPQADSVTAPAGWKLVPVAPTQEMLDAGFNSTWSHSYTSCWRAMISAAPTPPAQAADSVPVAPFDDPKVQMVYAILCEDAEPPKGEHWEGFAARRIVDALSADSVTEDAARYRYLRDGDWREHEKLESIIRLQLNALWDETIDAARKQGANHD